MNPEDEVMTFGCHKGKKLSQVPHDYLKWMERTITDKPELIEKARLVLAAAKPTQPFDPNQVNKTKAEIEKNFKKRPQFTLTQQNVDHVFSLGESLPREVYIRASTKTEMEKILQKCEEYTGCLVKTRWAAQGRILIPEAQYAYVFKWQNAMRRQPIDVFVYDMDQTIFDPEEEDRLRCLEVLNALAKEQNPVEEE